MYLAHYHVKELRALTNACMGQGRKMSSVYSGLAIRELIITDDHFWIFCYVNYLVRCTMHAARRGAKLCDDFTGGETANIMSM
jgi:hypothetical protein